MGGRGASSGISTGNFSASKYLGSHGKMPRGRGMWIFETANGKSVTAYGSLPQAKKQAATEFKKMGEKGTIYIMP